MDETTEPAQVPQGQPAQGRKKSPVDRRVKLGFALAFVLGIALIAYFQLRGPMLGWPGDLAAALAQAKRENRPVVVFVRSFPITETGKRMVRTTLAKSGNKEALQKGNFLLAEVRLSREAAWAKKYGMTRTPTMLLIAPDGERFHKQEGFIGELDFRTVFLKARPK